MARFRIIHLALLRLFFAGAATTVLVPLFLHFQLSSNEGDIEYTKNTAAGPGNIMSHKGEKAKAEIVKSKPGFQDRIELLKEAINEAENGVLDFFVGEKRALEDGVPNVAEKNAPTTVLSQRLADRINRCRQQQKSDTANEEELCTLKIYFVGSAQTTGRDNFRNQTFPFVVQKRLRSIAEAAGLRLEVVNNALDNDMGREGPQTCHMCISNLIGTEQVDVIGWDYDDSMKGGRFEQFEAFIRWAFLATKPALIIVNRDGPHGLSRRGEKHTVIDLSPGHKAIVYEDIDPPPEPRQELYRTSQIWKTRWEKRNSFWRKLFNHYSPNIDFAAVDPVGSIWHLDHLLEFSNQAFDSGKVLPLVDCPYPDHPPPCDQHPQFILNHLARANLTEADIPNDTDGILCGGLWGCRHYWYGGPRTHVLRGQLNALPIVRAFRDAVAIIKKGVVIGNENHGNLPSPSLPPPIQCHSLFCDKIPRCITSYEPNLSFRLRDHFVSTYDAKSKLEYPRLGIIHFANNPTFQLKDHEKRVAPLGYIDRKFAFRMAVGKNDTRFAAVNFTSESGSGPLVVCEPPCYSDECPTKRKMPLPDYVTYELDGVEVHVLKNITSMLIGRFCSVLSQQLTKGPHTLRLSTKVVAPSFVMLSHVISF